jgi:membrane peptidoglycan carboxypeptidase
MQLAAAFSAVVNGGTLYQPQLVRQVLDENGGVVERFEPKPIRRVLSEATSEKMRSYLEQAVEDGTGGKARVDDVRVGGKTGTARQVVNGEYSQTKYNASFIGAFPIDDPQYVILIMIHTPTVGKYYGGEVGAPIFRGVVERIALRNPSLREAEEIEKTFAAAAPYVGSPKGAPGKLDSVIAAKTADKERMPDLHGASLREAVAVMSALNLRYEFVGSGKVRSQTIKPGARIAPGMTCVLKGENVEMAEAGL